MRSRIASAIDSGADPGKSEKTAAPAERPVRRLMTSMSARRTQEAAAPMQQSRNVPAADSLAEPAAAQRSSDSSRMGEQQGDSYI